MMRSGFSSIIFWTFRFLVPPTLGFNLNHELGCTQNLVIPTTSSSNPRSNNNSVIDGTVLMIRILYDGYYFARMTLSKIPASIHPLFLSSPVTTADPIKCSLS